MEITVAPRTPKRPIKEARYDEYSSVSDYYDKLTDDGSNKRKWKGLRKSDAQIYFKNSVDQGPIEDGPLAGYHVHTLSTVNALSTDFKSSSQIALVEPKANRIDMLLSVTRPLGDMANALVGISRRRGVTLDPYYLIREIVVNYWEEIMISETNDEMIDMIKRFIKDSQVRVVYGEDSEEEITDPNFLQHGQNLISDDQYDQEKENSGFFQRKRRKAFKQTEASRDTVFKLTPYWT